VCAKRFFPFPRAFHFIFFTVEAGQHRNYIPRLSVIVWVGFLRLYSTSCRLVILLNVICLLIPFVSCARVPPGEWPTVVMYVEHAHDL
jgi:hypothetical protein